MMQSKHKITVILLLGLGCALLAGCTTYGVDNNTWKGMSPQERQIAMTQYYRQQARAQAQQAQIDKINAENAPINNAISALSGMAGNAASNSQRKCQSLVFHTNLLL